MPGVEQHAVGRANLAEQPRNRGFPLHVAEPAQRDQVAEAVAALEVVSEQAARHDVMNVMVAGVLRQSAVLTGEVIPSPRQFGLSEPVWSVGMARSATPTARPLGMITQPGRPARSVAETRLGRSLDQSSRNPENPRAMLADQFERRLSAVWVRPSTHRCCLFRSLLRRFGFSSHQLAATGCIASLRAEAGFVRATPQLAGMPVGHLAAPSARTFGASSSANVGTSPRAPAATAVLNQLARGDRKGCSAQFACPDLPSAPTSITAVSDFRRATIGTHLPERALKLSATSAACQTDHRRHCAPIISGRTSRFTRRYL